MINLEDLEPKENEFKNKTLSDLVDLMKTLERAIFDDQCYGVNDVTLLLRVKKELVDRNYHWKN